MAADYKSYLATAIISDQRTITYRTLSRHLKCHNNAAKRMLFDFHKRENTKKAGSVHATYLLSGVRKPPDIPSSNPTQNGTNGNMDMEGDVPPSSPPMSSSLPAASQEQSSYVEEVPVLTITLVREEELDEVKQSYQSVSSIHIYSLEPAPLQDWNVLTSCNQELFDNHFAKEDPLEYNSKYGVIQNKDVRRRTNRRPPPPPAPAPAQPATSKTAAKSAATSSKPSAPQAASKPELKRADSQESQPRPYSRGKIDTKPPPPTKSSTLKRDTSDLFKSFAKTSQKPKVEPKKSPAGPSAASTEDTPMNDVPSSDSEGSEDSTLFNNANSKSNSKSKRPSDTNPSRQEREAKLRKMMDDEDNEDNEDDNATAVKADKSDSPMPDINLEDEEADAEAADWSASDPELENAPTPPVQPLIKKRRRGRRQVMKKRTTKDDEGYLVTREEPVWESFSESEPEVQPQMARPMTKPGLKREESGGKMKDGGKEKEKEKGGKKAGGGTAGKGQGHGQQGKGSIMSFFAKKYQ